MLKKNGPGRCCCIPPGCETCKTEFVAGWAGAKNECVCTLTRNYGYDPSGQLIQPIDRDSKVVFHGAQSPPFHLPAQIGTYYRLGGSFMQGGPGNLKFRGSYALEFEASGVDENAAVIFMLGSDIIYQSSDLYAVRFLMGRGRFSPWLDERNYDWGTSWNNSPHLSPDHGEVFIPSFDWPVGDPITIRIEIGHVSPNADVLSSAEHDPNVTLDPTHWWTMYAGGTRLYSGEIYGSHPGPECFHRARPFITFYTPDTIKYRGPWYKICTVPSCDYEAVRQDEIEEPNLPTGIKIHSVKEFYDNGLINCPSVDGLGNYYSPLTCGTYGQVKLPENTYPKDPDAADDCAFYESGCLPYIRGEEFPSTTASLQFSGVAQTYYDYVFSVTNSTHEVYRSGLPNTWSRKLPSRPNWIYTRKWDDFLGPEITFVNNGPNPSLYGPIWISSIEMRMWNFNHQGVPYPATQYDWNDNVTYDPTTDRPPNNSLYLRINARYANPIDPTDPSLVQDGPYMGRWVAYCQSGFSNTLTFKPYYQLSPSGVKNGFEYDAQGNPIIKYKERLLTTGTITLNIGG